MEHRQLTVELRWGVERMFVHYWWTPTGSLLDVTSPYSNVSLRVGPGMYESYVCASVCVCVCVLCGVSVPYYGVFLRGALRHPWGRWEGWGGVPGSSFPPRMTAGEELGPPMRKPTTCKRWKSPGFLRRPLPLQPTHLMAFICLERVLCRRSL